MIYATPGVLGAFPFQFIVDCLGRHQRQDWGCVSPEDAKANDEALKHGERLLSAYELDGKRLWILTEADRSMTTVLLPDEY